MGKDSNELVGKFRSKVHSRAQAAAGHWAWTPSSNWANELRGGLTHYTLQIIPSDTNFPYVINTGISNPLLHGIPNIKMSGFTELGAFHNFPKIVGPDKVYSFVDQVSSLRGNHAFKFDDELLIALDKLARTSVRSTNAMVRTSLRAWVSPGMSPARAPLSFASAAVLFTMYSP